MAVSGGPDSVALLDILIRLSLGDRGGGLEVRREKRRSGKEAPASTAVPQPLYPSAPASFSNAQPTSRNPHLHIAHLDHMLRGSESAEDAEFVRSLAGRLGVQATIRAADVRALHHVPAEASRRPLERFDTTSYGLLRMTSAAIA